MYYRSVRHNTLHTSVVHYFVVTAQIIVAKDSWEIPAICHILSACFALTAQNPFSQTRANLRQASSTHAHLRVGAYFPLLVVFVTASLIQLGPKGFGFPVIKLGLELMVESTIVLGL